MKARLKRDAASLAGFRIDVLSSNERAGPGALVAAEATTILRTMRDLIEAHTPSALPPIDLEAPRCDT